VYASISAGFLVSFLFFLVLFLLTIVWNDYADLLIIHLCQSIGLRNITTPKNLLQFKTHFTITEIQKHVSSLFSLQLCSESAPDGYVVESLQEAKNLAKEKQIILGKLGYTPLHGIIVIRRASMDMEKLVMEYIEFLNSVDDMGWTPLHHAAYLGQFDMCLLLLRNKANFDIQNEDGQKAEDVAKLFSGIKKLIQKVRDNPDIIDEF
jgi:ankyrin repeat protein